MLRSFVAALAAFAFTASAHADDREQAARAALALAGKPVGAPTARALTAMPDPNAVEPQASVVLVTVRVDERTTHSATGTVVACEKGKSLILTNQHVCPDATRPVTVTAGKVTYKATVLAVATADYPDLALLVAVADLPAATLAAREPKVGSRIRQWGFSERDDKGGPIFKTGTVTDSSHYVHPVTTGTLPCKEGDSGAALWDDAGAVVGVTCRRSDDPYARVVAMPLPAVRAFLRLHADARFPVLTAKLGGKPPVELPTLPPVPPKVEAKPEASKPPAVSAPTVTYREVYYRDGYGRLIRALEAVPAKPPCICGAACACGANVCPACPTTRQPASAPPAPPVSYYVVPAGGCVGGSCGIPQTGVRYYLPAPSTQSCPGGNCAPARRW